MSLLKDIQIIFRKFKDRFNFIKKKKTLVYYVTNYYLVPPLCLVYF